MGRAAISDEATAPTMPDIPNAKVRESIEITDPE
jgi:hypothetical protein